jgi:hypothetical protein
MNYLVNNCGFKKTNCGKGRVCYHKNCIEQNGSVVSDGQGASVLITVYYDDVKTYNQYTIELFNDRDFKQLKSDFFNHVEEYQSLPFATLYTFNWANGESAFDVYFMEKDNNKGGIIKFNY